MLRDAFFALAETGYADGFETRLRGSREMIEAATISAAKTIDSTGQWRFSAQRANYPHGQPIVTIRAEEIGSNRGGSIGILECVEAPDDIVWLRIPKHRGSAAENAWRPDNEGRLFAEFLSCLFGEFEKLGFLLPAASRGAAVLKSVIEQLATARDANSYAAVGNGCRGALIALANEVYAEQMKPEDDTPPKGDDATAKLKYFIGFQLSSVSQRYRTGLQRTVDGTWELANALVHRKSATRGDAETCVQFTQAVVDGVSRLRPDHESRRS